MRVQPSCPFATYLDGCATDIPSVDKEIDRPETSDPITQRFHRRVTELTHVGSANPKHDNSIRALLDG